ncbi:cysteine--tRNA ligase [Halomonas cibimaris]|uniref:Cysteine--tRNA ligase n=1 Tax=Halomonas cibimaris TaxID=657012 RepID=A0ABP7LWU5_9GAMM
MQVYNTLTRRKEPLAPLEPGKIGMYVCGMTVYDYCHLGHARVMVAFDLISRYLRARGFDVTYVRNITDIDDKILQRAADNGERIEALTERMIAAMHEDEARLGVLPPDAEPRATGHVDEIIAMIETLIEKGYAYPAANGDVYYRVRRFAEYGRLNNRNLDDMRAGARVDVDDSKEDPLDFVLWKAAKPGEAHWPSPWGKGRPGWHIECSAMSTCSLGNTFDIHGGGPDLTFPHHENEIAQSEAATGQTYVNTWMHAGAVRVDQEKMSKSLGNFFTIRDVLTEHDPEVVRYLLVASHYRSAINYSVDSLTEARKSLTRLYTALDSIEPAPFNDSLIEPQSAYARRFIQAMDDDFNTPEALAVLFELTRDLNRARAEGDASAPRLAGELRALGGVLGLLSQPPGAFLHGGDAGVDAAHIESQIARRAEAKAAKNFALADAIRDELAGEGVILKDSREGTRWVIQSADG